MERAEQAEIDRRRTVCAGCDQYRESGNGPCCLEWHWGCEREARVEYRAKLYQIEPQCPKWRIE